MRQPGVDGLVASLQLPEPRKKLQRERRVLWTLRAAADLQQELREQSTQSTVLFLSGYKYL